jgi:hypothetical protein
VETSSVEVSVEIIKRHYIWSEEMFYIYIFIYLFAYSLSYWVGMYRYKEIE